jgi:TIR domain.
MAPAVRKSTDRIVEIVRQCLEEGSAVEIDGLGVFRPGSDGYEFYPATGQKIFIAYVQEDHAYARRLYDALKASGFEPWLDRKKLLPGQNWPRAIERAIEVSDFFVACLSRRALRKRGQFQAEMRFALDCARRQPLDRVYFIPLRLEECPVPLRISRETQYVDLFPDWEEGLRRVISTMQSETANRQ